MNIVVLDAATLGADIDLSPLHAVGTVIPYAATSEEEMPLRVREADVIVANKARLNAATLASATRLKLICEAATGYDNIDVSWCKEQGIAVANVAGYSTHSVAQVTLAMALSLYTHLPEYHSFVASGAYSKSNCFNRLEPVYCELAGKTWGIVGLGNIGRQVACVAQAMGCRVIAHTRTPREGYDCVSLDTLCRESDIISLHTPLTDATRHLIGREQLTKMKDGCVLINVARGAVTDEEAVAEAVLSGKILFGCDVYAREPFATDHPYTKLLDRTGVCLTPHMAWGSREARQRCVAEIAENISAFYLGNARNRIV